MANILKIDVLNSVVTQKSESWLKLENILLTATMGILGASSIGFTLKGGTFARPTFLKISWILLSASLVFLLASYAVFEYFASDLIKKLKKQPDVFPEEDFEGLKNKIAMMGIAITNYLSLACTISGILFMVAFGYVNIA
jgi:hypothetical protein